MIDLLQQANPHAIYAGGFEDAIVGYTVSEHHAKVAVYDVDKCVEILVERDGATHEQADEHIFVNALCAFFGENGPLFMKVTKGDEGTQCP